MRKDYKIMEENRKILAQIMQGIEPDGYIENPESKIKYPTWRLDKLYLKIPRFVYSFPLLIDYDYSWIENEDADFLSKKTKKWFALVETINPRVKLHKQQIYEISSMIKEAFKNSLDAGLGSVQSVERLLLCLHSLGLLKTKAAEQAELKKDMLINSLVGKNFGNHEKAKAEIEGLDDDSISHILRINK